MIYDPPGPTFDLRAFARRVVLDGITDARGDPTEMKRRIMLARQCGHLTDQEAEEWIAMTGLKND